MVVGVWLTDDEDDEEADEEKGLTPADGHLLPSLYHSDAVSLEEGSSGWFATYLYTSVSQPITVQRHLPFIQPSFLGHFVHLTLCWRDGRQM